MNKEVFEDYYKLLGVTRNVTPEELRKVRRDFSKKYHPDLVQDEQEKEKRHKILSRINNAVEVLSNPSISLALHKTSRNATSFSVQIYEKIS